MKFLKNILSLLLIIAMLTTLASLTACKKDSDDNEENENTNNDDNQTNETKKDTYTVTIVDGDNNPVEGVSLVISDGKTYPQATTDAEGKASVALDDQAIGVMISKLPDGYVKPEKVNTQYHALFQSGAKDLTVRIEKEVSNKVEYTVTVVDQDGNPVVGMNVQLCYGSTCLPAEPTDDFGEVTSDFNAGTEVKVKLYALDGYTLPTPPDGEYHAVIESGETEITIVVTKN